MKRNRFNRMRHCFTMVLLLMLTVPMSSFGQDQFIVGPKKKTETNKKKEETNKPKKDNDKVITNTGRRNPGTPAAVHSQKWAVDNILKNMVKVEGGQCMIGSDSLSVAASEDNTPAHAVSLSTFYIGKYEVTEEEWQLIMGSNPSDKANGLVVSPTCPVDNVSWEDCQLFIEKLSRLTGKRFRLPTEAEWEFAAKGGQTTQLPFSGTDDIESCAWFRDNSSKIKHPVGQKKPNQLGLYDMTGNVREWCQDFFESGYYAKSPELNPQGPEQGERRIVRGGSFNNPDGSCFVTYRSYSSPDIKNKYTGLRLAYSEE